MKYLTVRVGSIPKSNLRKAYLVKVFIALLESLLIPIVPIKARNQTIMLGVATISLLFFGLIGIQSLFLDRLLQTESRSIEPIVSKSDPLP